MHDRMGVEIIARRADPQALEEVAPSLQGCPHGSQKEGFAETAGSGQKVVALFLDDFLDKFGFVHVEKIIISDNWEILAFAREFMHARLPDFV
jgi:hypothetical protein